MVDVDVDQDLADADADETTLVIGSWDFQGLGWTTAGDAALAARASALARGWHDPAPRLAGMGRDHTGASSRTQPFLGRVVAVKGRAKRDHAVTPQTPLRTTARSRPSTGSGGRPDAG